MLTRPLYRAIAEKLQAIENCRKANNAEWEARHSDAIEDLVKAHMPSGSGRSEEHTSELQSQR